MHSIKVADEAEADRCVNLIVQAFSGDPAVRWMYPDSQQYLEHFPHFVRAFGGPAFEHGSAHCTVDYSAAALWLPPDVHPYESQLMALIERSIPESRQGALFTLLEQMGGLHPNEPHWYLPLIGVDPAQQCKGHGSALLKHGLDICDRDKLPAYLEATNPRGVPLYQRHGFEALGTIQYGTSPPIVAMLRKPR